MRRPIFTAFVIAFLSYFLIAPDFASAQGDAKIRAGLKYNTHVEEIGVSVGGDFSVADMIRAGGDFTYYFVDDSGFASASIWTINLNGMYNLLMNDTMTVHGVAGINILNWSYEYDGNFFGKGLSYDDSATDVGLNAGAMAEFGAGSLGFWAQALVVGLGGDSSGLALGGGVSFGL